MAELGAGRVRPGERGTALVLAPALVLVVIVLGGLAVDLALVRSAQRELDGAVAAAADDAAGRVDQHRSLTDGALVVDRVAAVRTAEARLDTTSLPGRIEHRSVTVGGREVRVSARLAVPPVFLAALGDDRRTVTASAVARLAP